MSNSRLALGQIKHTKKGILAFQMVNQKNQSYLIYDDPLITIFENPNNYCIVKRRDKTPSSYYPGEILGKVHTSNNGKNKIITIYIGLAEKSIELDNDTNELSNIVETHKYTFPKDEIDNFVNSISTMNEQNHDFNLLMRNSEVRFKIRK